MVSQRAVQISEYLQQSLGDMIELLKQMVESESPSIVPEAQKGMFSILATALKGLGFNVAHVPGRSTGGYLYAVHPTRRKHQPYQVLLGHCDTVWPIGTISDMPFFVDGRIARGPGVFDMKGGLVQMIYALEAATSTGYEAMVTSVVLINSDEEIGSIESGPQIRRLARSADRVLVLEPALGLEGKLKTTRRGAGKFYVRVRGRSAHTGLDPEAGASAILELSHVIQSLHRLNRPERGISVNVGMIEGGIGSNVVAPESSAVVDVRVVDKEAGKWIVKKLRELTAVTPGTSIEIDGRFGRDPMESTPRNRALWRRAKAAAGELGIEIDEGRSGGVSDANITSGYTATIDGLGAVGDGAHAAHEFVRIDKLVERTALLALMVMQPPLSGDATSLQAHSEPGRRVEARTPPSRGT